MVRVALRPKLMAIRVRPSATLSPVVLCGRSSSPTCVMIALKALVAYGIGLRKARRKARSIFCPDVSGVGLGGVAAVCGSCGSCHDESAGGLTKEEGESAGESADEDEGAPKRAADSGLSNLK